MTAPNKLTPSRQAADALVAAGLVPAVRADAAAAIITSYMPKGGSYSFSADAEFMHACLDHHVGSYFRQVMEPSAKAHHGGAQGGGRLLKDQEIEAAAVEITSQIMNELGEEYCQHMARYLGDETGITTYIFSRVHGSLLDVARKFNDDYLASISKKMTVKRTAASIGS
jgi:hypothetical protein